MPDLDRIRYLAENYRSLQGLRRVPFGVLFVGMGTVHLWSPAAWRQYFGPTTTGLTLGYLAAILLWWAVIRMYRARYGWMTAEKRRVSKGERVLGTVWVVGLFGALVYDNAHPQNLVYLTYLFFAAPVLYCGWSDPRRRHYFVAGILLAALALNPRISALSVVREGIDQVVFGVVAVATGIADHLVWVRGLRGLRAGDHGQSL